MTDDSSRPTSPLDDNRLEGFTIEQLSDYLDHGRQPRDPAIEASAAAQHALAALSRLRTIAPQIIARDANEFAPENDNWVKRILDQIGVQAHAGRDIPVSHTVAGAHVYLTEGAARALVREVGDSIEGLIVERCRFDGELDTAGVPVTVNVDISVTIQVDLDVTGPRFRELVFDALTFHSQLDISEVSIHVRDRNLDEEDGRAK